MDTQILEIIIVVIILLGMSYVLSNWIFKFLQMVSKTGPQFVKGAIIIIGLVSIIWIYTHQIETKKKYMMYKTNILHKIAGVE